MVIWQGNNGEVQARGMIFPLTQQCQCTYREMFCLLVPKPLMRFVAMRQEDKETGAMIK